VISIQDQQYNAWRDWILSGQFVQQLLDAYIMLQKKRHKYDGYIHGSSLNWNQSFEKQYENGKKIYNPPIELARTSFTGDIFHENIQKCLTKHGWTAHPEFEMIIEPWKFSGTLDLLLLNTLFGNIVFEFKTVEKYERNKADGDRIWEKLCKHRTPDGYGIGYNLATDAFFTDDKIKEIKERLYVRPRHIVAQPKHLTQMFTYSYVLETCYRIPVHLNILCYVNRSDFTVAKEFAYWRKESQYYYDRARDNLAGVLQCMHTSNNG